MQRALTSLTYLLTHTYIPKSVRHEVKYFGALESKLTPFPADLNTRVWLAQLISVFGPEISLKTDQK